MAAVSLTKGKSSNATIVDVNDVRLLFSYETIVAFWKSGEGWFASNKSWSVTTSKHIKQETGIDLKDRIPHEEFVSRLDGVLSSL